MASKPQRSIRLEKRSARSLAVLSGAPGEIFFDNDNGTLRVYTDTTGDSIILANRQWVLDNTFDGNYTSLSGTPTNISVFNNDINYATLTQVNNAVAAIDLTGYATETYVDNAVSGLAPTTLETLTDVTYTGTPQTNDVLTWNGTGWANSPAQVDLSSYYTSAETDTAISTAISNFQTTIVDAAPAALDTLNELAAALGDDANFATTVTTALSGKEPAITAGTTSQYWRGDKSWATLNSSAVGLGNVTNESKTTMFSSPTFTGNIYLDGRTPERINTVSYSGSTVTLNTNNGTIFELYVQGIPVTGDFALNFTNALVTSNVRSQSMVVIMNFTSIYAPTSILVDGFAVDVLWQGGGSAPPPSGVSNVYSFTYVRNSTGNSTFNPGSGSGAAYILASMVSYG